ncbi:MAG TPA: lysoplasmalogenase [Saprospiraceae bacterium]|nr:lysoplasmalogenase [Saprospiraceae bacterium]HMQ84505.1 lysoplasmalogenase [Saprospiraceae bacterium]
MKNASIALVLFFCCALLNLWAEYAQQETLVLVSKPLLMPLLAGWFYGNVAGRFDRFCRWVLLALLFSFGGDTLLLFVEHGPRMEIFFLLGLASFLVAHLFYIAAFRHLDASRTGLIFQSQWVLVFFAAFLAGMLLFLWPGIPGDMKVPVAVYSTVIVTMAVSAFNLKNKLPPAIFRLLFTGVLLFVLSDSLIAVNKFSDKVEIGNVRVWIMLTYLAAQYSIIRAVIHKKTTT